MTRIVNISVMGKVDLQYSLKYGEYNVDIWACDSGAAWPYYKCDPFISYYLVSGGFVKAEDAKSLLGELETSFSKDKYFLRSNADWPKRGLDVSYYSDDEFTNHDYINYWKLIYYSSNMFYKIVGICATSVEQNLIYWDNVYYGSECNFKFIRNLDEFNTITINLYYHSLLRFYVKTLCQSNYYEPTCWRKCENSTIRFYCDLYGNEICMGNFESITYGYKYLMVQDVYNSWNEEIVYRDHCQLINLCYDHTLKQEYECANKTQLCYPIANSTKSCASFYHKYIIPGYTNDSNITFQSLLNKENVQFTFFFKGESVDILWNHTTCTWTYPSEKNYLPFSVLNNGTHLIYPISIPYGTYYFTIQCVLGEYRTRNYFRVFNIHVIPTIFKIFNTSLGNNEIIYIGQTVRCQSNAVPQNISVHLIFFLSENFKPKYKSFTELDIPVTAMTGGCLIECLHFFQFTDGRQPENITEILNLEIKSYVYFEWRNPFKNQYTIYESTGCIYLVYFEGYIIVTVLERQSDLKTSPYDNFTLQVSRGGKYVLLCRLSDENDIVYFIKSKTIEISFEPTLLCLMPYFATPGSIIIFAHNGYPPDEVNIEISLYANSEEISYTRVTYIKIPYEVNSEKLLLLGKITFTLKSRKKVLQVNKEIIFRQETNRIVSITNNDQVCADYSEYEIRYHQLSSNVLQFDAEILELKLPNKTWIELLYCFYLSPLFLMVFIIYVTKRIKTIRTFETRRKAIKYRFLNDYLAHQSRRSAGPEHVFSEQFTRLRSMQTYSDEADA